MKRSTTPAVLLLIAACTYAPAPTAAPPCPATWTGQAPEPATVAGVSEELVPGDPVGALVCAYAGVNWDPGGEALTGQRRLSHEVMTLMARDLNDLPPETGSRSCTLVGGPQINYLVRVDYADGKRVWLTTGDEVNQCVSTGNGTFATGAYVGEAVTAAYKTGKWTTPEHDDPCYRSLGRRGQEERMVPDRPVGVLVCGEHSKRDHGPDVARALAGRLNMIATRPAKASLCTGTPREEYRLQFRYAEGPGVGVTVLVGCRPPVHNGSLSGIGELPQLKALSQGG
ncbi:hypothetical protein [Herbidospora cretacea]|uniref:hypothetical protein n=1 Tax=Herbidospora cretacea TaxID=28444 RepID=UPI0012DC032F|nr:hypothetical protein [Herbidospora cretacea]